MIARRELLAVLVVTSACGGRSDERGRTGTPVAAVIAPVSEPVAASVPDADGVIDLLAALRVGSIDVDGPVVDFGEPSSRERVLPPVPLREELVNGTSWATVGARVRVHVPIDPTRPPDTVRIRVRHAVARAVLVLVDGVPARQGVLPLDGATGEVALSVAPERFRRDAADIELRFVGLAPIARTVATTPPAERAPTRRAPAPPRAVAEIDWLHLSRGTPPTLRAADLTADVAVERVPRRALVMYAPTRLETIVIVPEHATLRAVISAEGIQGQGRTGSVAALVRVTADDIPPLELRTDVHAGDRWTEAVLDLGAVAGKVARVSVSAVDDGDGPDARLAVAEPRIVGVRAVTTHPAAPFVPVRQALLVVVRGARADRFLPVPSIHFGGGGSARMVREGLGVRVLAASPRSIPALASVLTGLTAGSHGLVEITDALDDGAPTLGTRLREGAVLPALFTDDRSLFDSGLDHGFAERHACAGDAALCRAEPVMAQAVDWLLAHRDRRVLAAVVSRAGLPPFDPPPDLLAAIDPNPVEGALTSEQSGQLALRSRHGALALDARESARLAALYDASLAGVDRGLALALERLPRDVAVVLVGDRGTALGENGLVGEGPLWSSASAYAPLLVMAPGVNAWQPTGAGSVLDLVPTVLSLFGIEGDAATVPRPDAGASLVPVPDALRPRGTTTVVDARGAQGLAFGSLFAFNRALQGLVLIAPDRDPFAQEDLAASHPIARAYASAVLETLRNDPPRSYPPSTRVLAPNVEAALRAVGWLRR